MDKPNVFITIDKAGIAKNLFFNKHIAILKNKFNIIIFTPASEDKSFLELFKDYKVEKLKQPEYSSFKKKLIKKFVSFHKALIYNPSVELGTLYGTWYGGVARNYVRFKFLRIIVQKYFLGVFLKYSFFRDLFKLIDRIIFQCRDYDDLIDKYKPELVFITNISSNNEIPFLRNCKKRGIKSVGMAKSWDNLSKWGFREKADKLIVWSSYMKDEALMFQDYKKENIEIVGIPQFDYYNYLDSIPRDEFCTKFKLDPNKKTIFFGSEGPICTSDPYIVSFIKEKIKDGTLRNYQVLVRPHCSYDGDEDRFMDSVDNKIVFIDLEYERSNFKDRTELSLNNVINLISSIRNSNISITSASTLVLDIVANGKYPILYNFDKDKDIPFKDSTKRLYKSLWMKEIINIGLDNLANIEEELVEKILEADANPEIKLQERKKLIKRFCYKVDGKSGERLYNYIVSLVRVLNN